MPSYDFEISRLDAPEPVLLTPKIEGCISSEFMITSEGGSWFPKDILRTNYNGYCDIKELNFKFETLVCVDYVNYLNEIFKDEKSALAACQAKFKRVSKSNKTFNFSCAGRPDLFAESPLVLRGFGSKILTKWIMNRVEHSLSSSGFVTNVDCCAIG